MTCSPSRCPHAGLLDVRKMDDFEVEKVEGLLGLQKVLKTLRNPIPKDELHVPEAQEVEKPHAAPLDPTCGTSRRPVS